MENTRQRIENDVKTNKVFLYMKGTPDAPQCGFSARAVQILRNHNVPFGSFNVFSDEEIRQGVKEFSNWPTFPQLYVNGQLVGGCDIMVEMDESGELGKILKNS